MEPKTTVTTTNAQDDEKSATNKTEHATYAAAEQTQIRMDEIDEEKGGLTDLKKALALDKEYYELNNKKTEILRQCKENHQKYLSKLNLPEPDLNKILSPFSEKMSEIHTKLYQLQQTSTNDKDSGKEKEKGKETEKEKEKEISLLKQEMFDTKIAMNKALIEATKEYFEKDKSLVLTRNELSIKMNIATRSYQIAMAKARKQQEIEKAKSDHNLGLIATLSNELGKIESELGKPAIDVKLENETNREWHIWKQSILEHPTILSGDIALSEYKAAIERHNKMDSKDTEETMLMAIDLFHQSLEKKCSLLHKRHVYLISQFYQDFVVDHDTSGFTTRGVICNTIYNELNELLMKIGKNKDKIVNDKLNDMSILTSEELHYANMLLSWEFSSLQWDNDDYYTKLMSNCKDIVDDIQFQFDKLFHELQETESELLTLKIDDSFKADPKITSNRELLEDKFSSWYHDKGEIDGKEMEEIQALYKKWDFDCSNKYFENLMKYNPFNDDLKENNYRFLTCDSVVLDILDQIAPSICTSLYPEITYVFGTNRVLLKLPFDKSHQDRGIGLLKVPNKNKGQIIMKASNDCTDDPNPRCLSVLDIVRCSVVCETESELSSLFDKLCERYKGKIVKILNRFDGVHSSVYGYRNIVMNIIYENKKLLPGFPLIVEIRLELLDFLKIHSKMSFIFPVIESKNARELARNACKMRDIDVTASK